MNAQTVCWTQNTDFILFVALSVCPKQKLSKQKWLLYSIDGVAQCRRSVFYYLSFCGATQTGFSIQSWQLCLIISLALFQLYSAATLSFLLTAFCRIFAGSGLLGMSMVFCGILMLFHTILLLNCSWFEKSQLNSIYGYLTYTGGPFVDI